MRIVLVNNLYGAWARGGAERIVEREARALVARGHQVTVISLSPDGTNISTENGIVAYEVRSANLYPYTALRRNSLPLRFAWHVIDIFGPGAVREVVRLARGAEADVVHTHNLMGLGFMLPRALHAAGFRHVHTVHDVQLLHPSGLLPSSYTAPRNMAERAYVAMLRNILGSPDVVMYPSDALRKLHEAQGFFPSSDTRIVRNPSGRKTDEESDRTRSARTSFAFVGQLEPHKGVVTLVHAWEKWKGRKDATLTIVGTGSLERELRTIAARTQGIDVTGHLGSDAVRDVLSEATYAVVPSSVIENAPAVITEAFAEGTPVIAAKTGGIPELVMDGHTGFLFPPENEEVLIDTLKKAASTASWSQMAAAAKRSASLLSMDAHIASLEAVYASMQNE